MMKNDENILRALESMAVTVPITHVVALSKHDEKKIAEVLHELARTRPSILVCDVHDMLNIPEGKLDGSLEKIVHMMMRGHKDKKLQVPGLTLARLLASSITLHVQTRQDAISRVFIIGTPHNSDQVKPLHTISPSAKLVYVGHDLRQLGQTPYHANIIKAVKEFIHLGHQHREILPGTPIPEMESRIVKFSSIKH